MSDCGRPNPSRDIGRDAQREGLAGAVRLCGRTPAMAAELAAIYEEALAACQASGARCMGGGGCCKFDLAGHRLYLTAGELSFLLETPPRIITRQCYGPTATEDCDAGGLARSFSKTRGTVAPMRCPYQVRGRCQAYARRPLGCRIYFCRPADGDWCGARYEEYHARILRLHERLDVPYMYVELTAGIAEATAAMDR